MKEILKTPVPEFQPTSLAQRNGSIDHNLIQNCDPNLTSAISDKQSFVATYDDMLESDFENDEDCLCCLFCEVRHDEDGTYFEKLMEYGLNERISRCLDRMYASGKISTSDLDDRALDALKEFPLHGAILVLHQFASSNLTHVSNKSAYLCGVMKTFRQRFRTLTHVRGDSDYLLSPPFVPNNNRMGGDDSAIASACDSRCCSAMSSSIIPIPYGESSMNHYIPTTNNKCQSTTQTPLGGLFPACPCCFSSSMSLGESHVMTKSSASQNEFSSQNCGNNGNLSPLNTNNNSTLLYTDDSSNDMENTAATVSDSSCTIVGSNHKFESASPNTSPAHCITAVPRRRRRGPDPDRLQAILDRTGYSLDVTTGQRKYGGPPPGWDEKRDSLPGHGCEVFCGKIPRNVYEDELIPLFEQFGVIYDLRLMVDPLTGLNRGFAFISYTTRDAALEAVKHLDNYELVYPHRRIGVTMSLNNTRLYVGYIPKDRRRDELFQEFVKHTPGLLSVITYKYPWERNENRGFCFLDYATHKDASLAKRKIESGQFRAWGCNIHADWADPLEEPLPDVMNKVKVLYVRNLLPSICEASLRSIFQAYGGHVVRVKKIKDFAFIHFENRKDAEVALTRLNGKIFSLFNQKLYSQILDSNTITRGNGRTALLVEEEESQLGNDDFEISNNRLNCTFDNNLHDEETRDTSPRTHHHHQTIYTRLTICDLNATNGTESTVICAGDDGCNNSPVLEVSDPTSCVVIEVCWARPPARGVGGHVTARSREPSSTSSADHNRWFSSANTANNNYKGLMKEGNTVLTGSPMGSSISANFAPHSVSMCNNVEVDHFTNSEFMYGGMPLVSGSTPPPLPPLLANTSTPTTHPTMMNTNGDCAKQNAGEIHHHAMGQAGTVGNAIIYPTTAATHHHHLFNQYLATATANPSVVPSFFSHQQQQTSTGHPNHAPFTLYPFYPPQAQAVNQYVEGFLGDASRRMTSYSLPPPPPPTSYIFQPANIMNLIPPTNHRPNTAPTTPINLVATGSPPPPTMIHHSVNERSTASHGTFHGQHVPATATNLLNNETVNVVSKDGQINHEVLCDEVCDKLNIRGSSDSSMESNNNNNEISIKTINGSIVGGSIDTRGSFPRGKMTRNHHQGRKV